jgi:tetratricopeptide (TPR) repeat protein
MGRTQEAISEARLAQGLEPVSAALNTQLARVLYFARRYDDAIDECQKTLELDHDFGGAHFFLGRCYSQKGMYEQALTELGRAKDLWRDSAEVLSVLGYTRGMSGSPPEAQKILQELERQSTKRYISPYHIAMVYAGLGQQDKALDLLEKAYLDREGRMTVLKFAPEFDSLHSSPRFADLVRRVGLTPP